MGARIAITRNGGPVLEHRTALAAEQACQRTIQAHKSVLC